VLWLAPGAAAAPGWLPAHGHGLGSSAWPLAGRLGLGLCQARAGVAS
jgi:hypothetical protein